MSLRATSTNFLNTSRGGGSTTCLGSLFQCLTSPDTGSFQDRSHVWSVQKNIFSIRYLFTKIVGWITWQMHNHSGHVSADPFIVLQTEILFLKSVWIQARERKQAIRSYFVALIYSFILVILIGGFWTWISLGVILQVKSYSITRVGKEGLFKKPGGI